MKTRLALIVVIFCSICLTTSQNVNQKNKPHKVWVTSMDGAKYVGILSSANQEMLKIIENDYSVIEVEAVEIHRIQIRKINQAGRGALFGALSGLVVGGIGGFALGDDKGDLISFKAEEKAIIGALICTPIGAGFGALFGSTKKEFIIDGNIVKYNNHLQKFRQYAINPDSLE